MIYMKNPFDLTGRLSVVTGGAGGLGTEILKALAGLGSDLALMDLARTKDTSESLSAEISREFGVKCKPFYGDISKQADAETAAKQIADEFGRIDVLVNNAGMYGGLTMTPFEDITPEEWDKVLSINARGTWQVCAAVIGYMKIAGSGSIINISSCSIHEGLPLLCHYVASKGAVWAMTRTMAREAGSHNIRVNSITPGYTLTDASKSLAGRPEDFSRNYHKNIESRAIQRGMMPEDMTGTVLFLASDASSFITGQNINVDGGSIHY
jgi:3-oxoacyl-[acyl-carrier protein] reductase